MKIDRLKDFTTKVCIIMTILGFQLILVEIGSFLILRFYPYQRKDPRSTLSVYKGQPWTEKYWREMTLVANFEYHAYVGWRLRAFQGDTIVIDEAGLRRTYHSNCDKEDTYTVYIFGASHLWGTGAPDWATIPSFLAEKYVKAGRLVCVSNYGESGWVSTQGVIKLILELKRTARKPDLVIFYGNDTYTRYQSNRYDVHQNFDIIKRQFESEAARRQGSFGYVLKANTATLVERLALAFQLRILGLGRYRRVMTDTDVDRSARITVEAYLQNIDLVETLSKKYGFRYAFFWEPVIFVERKQLTPEEEEMRRTETKAQPGLERLFQKTYELVRAETRPGLFYIADVFSDQKETIYIDWAHIGPEGNRLVALRIYDIVSKMERGG